MGRGADDAGWGGPWRSDSKEHKVCLGRGVGRMRSLEAWKVRINVLTTSCLIYSTKLFLGRSKLLEISDWDK